MAPVSIIGEKYMVHTYKGFIGSLCYIPEWHQMLWEFRELDRQRGLNHCVSIKMAFIEMSNCSKLKAFCIWTNYNPMKGIFASRLQYAVEPLYFSTSPNTCFDFCPLKYV
jgi:hypothetical protein